MSDIQFALPFDPTGTAASNRIQSERQTISAPGWSDFYFIIPKMAPYFRESLTVIHHPSGRQLFEGVDFLPSHKFHDASLAVGKPVYGSLTFFDKTLGGVVELTYQSIGGEWTIDEATIQEILSNKLTNPRITTWEEVVEVPREFPVIDHEWDLVDMVGMSSVVEKLEGIRDAIILAGEGGLGDHLADFDNPHKTTKGQVGLGNVENFPIATVPQAQAGADNASYMTPLRVAQAITQQVLTPLNNHKSDFANPHQVTKAQVGLGSVLNYPIATVAEAEGGSNNTTYMTPLRVAQQIDVRAIAPLNNHIADKANPHGTTKAHVGLGNVQNFGIASVAEARTGTSNVLYMTPLLVMEAIQARVGDTLVGHINDGNNPHGTTKAQVGLGNVQNYPIATQAQAQTGTDNATYMTPLRVFEAIEVRVRQPMLDHVNNTNNPHGTTKAHVGLGNVDNFPTATLTQVEEGTSSATFVTPAGVRRMIQIFGGGDVDTHAARKDNPHEVTKSQVGLGSVQNFGIATLADFAAGVTTAYVTPKLVADYVASVNQSVQDHIDARDNPHEVTAAQVGAYTTSQVDQLLNGKLDSGAQALDSQKLQGKTLLELKDELSLSARYPEIRDEAGATWTLLGRYTEPAEDTAATIVAMITGGEGQGETETSQVALHLNINTPADSFMELMTGVKPAWTLGYRTVGDDFELWMRNVEHRNEVEIITSRQVVEFFVGTDEVITDEPVGLTTIATRVTSAGGGGTGTMSMEAISVVSTADEVTAARLVKNDFSDAIHDFVAVNTNTEKFFAAVDADTVKVDKLELNGQMEVYDPNPGTHTNYQFAMELDATASSGVLGVCVAYVERDGKRHGIYALRSDGRLVKDAAAGTAPGGKSFYKLFTVGYNLLTTDATLIEGVSAGLRWGDGVLDENRANPSTYNPSATANVWGSTGVGGKTRINVSKVGTQFQVDLVQTVGGSTVTKTVTFDVANDPILADLFSGPCGWGVLVNKSAAPLAADTVSVKAVSRPDAFRRYVQIVDGAEQSVNDYSGSAWLTTSVRKPAARTQQRLIYSELNGRLFFGRRDGSVKRVFIEADSMTDQNIATM